MRVVFVVCGFVGVGFIVGFGFVVCEFLFGFEWLGVFGFIIVIGGVFGFWLIWMNYWKLVWFVIGVVVVIFLGCLFMIGIVVVDWY